MASRFSRSYTAVTASNTIAPFLYQTRTLNAPLRYPFRPVKAHSRSPYSTQPGDDQNGADDASADSAPPKPKESYLKRRATNVQRNMRPNEPSKPRTALRTMTKEEKKTFGDLLEKLNSMRKENNNEAKPEGDVEVKGQDETLTRRPISDEDQREMAQISDIFDAVLKDIRRKRPNLEKLGPTGSQVDKPLQLANSEDKELDSWMDQNMPTQGAVRQVKRREEQKIEAALRDAVADGRGDVGVWEVCKERIFSMLKYLGEAQGLHPEHLPPPDPAFPALVGPKTPGDNEPVSKETQPAKEKTPENDQMALVATQPKPKNPDEELIDDLLNSNKTKAMSGPLDLPPFVPVEAVVGLLYPHMLLVAFRILKENFPKSPLISQFRSTIKAHGRVSTVIGSSIGLYNDLLYFYWRGCSDLPSIISVLEEMSLTGVEPNHKTVTMLDSIIDQRERDLRYYQKRQNAGKPVPKVPWWELAPNRKAMRQIMGSHGWAAQMRERFRHQRQRERLNPLRSRAERMKEVGLI